MHGTTHAKELVRLRHGKDVETLLRELYLERRISQAEIATHLGVSRWSVNAWLAEYGIRRIDRPPLAPLTEATA